MARKQRRDREPPRDFDFFRYEVWFAFALGALAMLLVSFVPLGAPIGFVAATLGTSWGLTHLLTRWMLRGRLDRQKQREDEEERERRALANREAAAIGNEQASRRRHRRRR